VEINLLPKQEDFVFSERKYPAFIGGVGSGKTKAGCIRSILWLNQWLDGVIVAPTFPMLRDATQETFFDILNEAGIKYDFNKSDGVCKVGGATVLFRSADNPDRLRGPNLSWFYLDEAAMMRELVWKVMLGRIRVKETSGWITSTPAGMNWVYEHWARREDPKYHLIHASTRDNAYLPVEFVQDLVDNYSQEFARQEIDGDFVAFEGLVYSEFSPSVHIIPPFEIPAHWRRVRGIDYGYQNPFVCLWGALDEDGRLYIYDEHYRAKTLLSAHAMAIKDRPGRFDFTVADHDAQDNAEMQALGIDTTNAKKEVIAGISKVKTRLKVAGDGRPRLMIVASCVNTIKELQSYRWQPAKDGVNAKEEPVKEYDHAMDTLRYIVSELDGGGIQLF
jgi:PBSX family phage terminase large subunit